MALNTPGLNRWQQMQAKPIGNLATSMAAPSAAQTDYKQRVQDYSRAMRALRQESRRAPTRMGRAQAAMERIKLGEQAVASGIEGHTGIRRAEDQKVAAQEYEQKLGQAGAAQAQANRLAMGALGVQGGQGIQGVSGLQGATGVQGATGLQGAPRNHDADGNGIPDMIQRPTEGIGASQQPRLGYKPEASMRSYDDSKIDLDGEIVETARGPLAQARRGLAQRIESGSITGDELKKEQRRLGISDAAMQRFTGAPEQAPAAATAATEEEMSPAAREILAAAPSALAKRDALESALAGVRQDEYVRNMERGESAGKGKTEAPKPKTAKKEARKAAEPEVPAPEPFVPASDAELAGRVVGGALGSAKRLGQQNLSAIGGAIGRATDRNLGALRHIGFRGSEALRGISASGRQNFGGALARATERNKRAIKDFYSGIRQNTR